MSVAHPPKTALLPEDQTRTSSPAFRHGNKSRWIDHAGQGLNPPKHYHGKKESLKEISVGGYD
jgi:hypothetical protein